VPVRILRDVILRTAYSEILHLHRPPIKFIGAWDTVAAYGLPVAELLPAVHPPSFSKSIGRIARLIGQHGIQGPRLPLRLARVSDLTFVPVLC
jgi:hypothetical protein